jgi:hypothetical protein
VYLQQFHLNIKYKKGSNNRVADCLSWPPFMTLTTLLNSCGHETFGRSQHFDSDHDFATTYQAVSAGKSVANFHLQDGLLCHLGHLCVPSSEHAKLISDPITVGWQDILEWTRWWPCCKSTFIGRNFDRMSTNISDHALPTPLPNHPLRSWDGTHPYRPLTNPGSPPEWITCPTNHPQRMAMTSFLWLLTGSLK